MDWNKTKRVIKAVAKDVLFHIATGRKEVEVPPPPAPVEPESVWRTIQLTKKSRNAVVALMKRSSEINDVNKERSVIDVRVEASEELCTELRIAAMNANTALEDKDHPYSYEIAWVGDKMEHSCIVELRRYTKGYGYFLGKKFISTEI